MAMDSKMVSCSRGGFSLVNEDLLQNILCRLPATSFAYAACVNKLWNLVCDRILSRPKLSSALSLETSVEVAVDEAVNKVLSEPIRPHFAIAHVGPCFDLDVAHKLLADRLGSTTPLVTSVARGIMGIDAISNEFKEIKWDEFTPELGEEGYNLPANVNRGITLMVGYVPGLIVEAIPVIGSKELVWALEVDKFVTDVRNYTSSVSHTTSPAAMIMFGDPDANMRPVLDKMDYAMSTQTVIVGDESGRFLHRSRDNSRNFSRKGSVDAVAIVFARDRRKPQGVGEIQFHITSSTGLSTVGSIYKAVSVRAQGNKSEISTWLTAKRDGTQEVLDGTTILNAINDEMENGIGCSDLYIGVTKRRKCSVGSEKVKMMTTLAFHEVQGGDESFLFVDGSGLKTGDSFRFYYSDPTTASTTCVTAFENLKRLKEDLNSRVSHRSKGIADEDHKKAVLGGMIFNCYGRGESFFGARNVDSSPFLDNFPGVPLTGTFSCGEIRRVPLSSYRQEDYQEDPARCCLHVYTCVYLVMSYTPALP